MIAMAQNLGLTIVAEGVETAEQCEFLRKEKCNEAQGSHFSRLVSAAEIAEMLETGALFRTD